MTVATRGVTIEAAIQSYANTQRVRLADQTLNRVNLPRLRAFAGWLREQGMPTTVEGVRREHIEAYIGWLQAEAPGRDGPGQQAATVSITYRVLRRLFNWLVEEDELRVSPMARMKAPKVFEKAPKVLTEAELSRLYKVCAGRSFDDRRDAALVRLLAESGMRRGEVAGLTVDDVHLDSRVLLVRAGTSKGRRDRLVPLSAEGLAAMDRYLRVRASHPHAGLPWLWLGKRGRLSDSGILQVVERRGRQAGVPGLHPHRFRHTFAHRGQREGMSVSSLMAIAGWNDPAMLKRYGRSAANELAMHEFRRVFDRAV